jgi:hypothetical protein
MHPLAVVALSAFDISPDPDALPLTETLVELGGGVAFYVLLACVLGTLVSIGVWVTGQALSNPRLASYGKVGVFSGIALGGLTAIAPALVEFAFNVFRGAI